MIKEAIEKILSLAPVETKEIDGRIYADRELATVKEPVAKTVLVHTLTGFVDLLQTGVEELVPEHSIIHVENHTSVKLIHKSSDTWGRRAEIITCTLPDERGFAFGQFMGPESFIIGLQSCFVTTPDLEYVLRTSSNLSAESLTVAEDDGISQRASVRRGVVLKGEEKVKARVLLNPWRTFREVQQPPSEFLFRLQAGGKDELPRCALFEADGGRWKLDAAIEVRDWLKNKITDIPVVA